MTKNKFFIVPIIMILAVIFVSLRHSAQAGPVVLDPDFDTDGIVTSIGVAGGSGTDQAHAVKIQSDGKIVVVGASNNASGDTDMAIWRYNPDGSLDTSFDSNGYATHHGAAGGNGDDTAKDLAIQSDGKIIVVGSSTNATPDKDMAIWRYNSNGSLDTTFDSDGFAFHNGAAGAVSNVQDTGLAVEIQSDGKYVVSGYSVDTTGFLDAAIWRYNTDGSLDTTFDTDGFVTLQDAGGSTNSFDTAYDLKILGNGKIVIAGRTKNSVNGSDDLLLAIYNTNGSLDTTFDTDGIVTHDNASGFNEDDLVNSLAIQSDGKFLLAGHSKVAPTNTDMAVWRFNTDGSLDTTFDSDGYLVYGGTAGGNGNDVAMEVLEQGDGKIVVNGLSTNASGNRDYVLWRFNANGSLDTTYDDVGYVVEHNSGGGGASSDDQGRDMEILRDGTYLGVGTATTPSGGAMAMWLHTELLSETDQAGIEVNIADVIALDCGADVDFGTVTPGTPVTAETTCTATTNAENGYTLQVKREDVDTTMDHTTDATSNITDKAAWTSGTPNATTAIDDVLGFGVYASTATKNTTWWGTGTACDDASNNYAGFPSAYDTIMTHSTYSATGTTTSVCYKVDLPSSQKSGSYDGVVVYQVYTNP